VRHVVGRALMAASLVALGVGVTLRGGSSRPPVMDFVVESTRDAGPGSLRDAILAADRSPGHARIVVSVKRIVVESALPAMINRHGIDIEAERQAGVIDADRQMSGAVLQIDSAGSKLEGLSVINAHVAAVVVNAPGVQLNSLNVSDSKVGVLLGRGARDSSIRASRFEGNETGVTAEDDVRGVTMVDCVFRGHTRAGLWLVGAGDLPAAESQTGRPPGEARVRVINGVFEGNAYGLVIGNRPTAVLKGRFVDNTDTAVLVLGGSARIEDSEFRGTGKTAISVTSSRGVDLARNLLVDNPAMALMVRDSEVTIERNVLKHNGLGIVSVVTRHDVSPLIRDNIIAASTADGVTLIGGSPRLERNQIVDNHGAGCRTLEPTPDGGQPRTTPQLQANVLRGNGIDMPPLAVYRSPGGS
jgi:hypothetical protein